MKITYLLLSWCVYDTKNTVNADPKFDVSYPDMLFKSLSRDKRWVTYPVGTAIGLLVAIALPVEVPEENLYFSLNFEANYNLPDNITQYYNSDIARMLHGITRRSVYDLIKNNFKRQNLDAEECISQIICEISRYDISHNGLLGSLLDILFRSSIMMSIIFVTVICCINFTIELLLMLKNMNAEPSAPPAKLSFVKLIANDNCEFLLLTEIACLSPTIKNLLTLPDGKINEKGVIYFPEITREVMYFVCKYLIYGDMTQELVNSLPKPFVENLNLISVYFGI